MKPDGLNLQMLHPAYNPQNSCIVFDNKTAARVVVIELLYILDGKDSHRLQQSIDPGKYYLYGLLNSVTDITIKISVKNQGELTPLFEEQRFTLENRQYEVREKNNTPYVIAYPPYLPLGATASCNPSSTPNSVPTSNYVSLKNSGTDIYSLDVTYTLNDKTVTKSTGGLTKYERKYIELPVGASQIKVEVRHAVFIKTWKTIYTDYHSNCGTYCYMVVPTGPFQVSVVEVNCYDC